MRDLKDDNYLQVQLEGLVLAQMQVEEGKVEVQV